MTETNDAFAPVEETRPVHKFEFTGHWRELLPIALVNLFLNIITLSLFRFWGRTRVRRYLWSRTSLMGDPFEYTGNGKELFIGFVVVLLLIFAPFYGLMVYGQTLVLTQPVLGGTMMGAAYLMLLFLFGLGWYRAQKFRLSRTRWRGIRGGLEDNGVRYGFKFLGMTLLTVFTLGLAAPYSANKLWGAESNTRRFGTAKFSYDGKSSQFYKKFIPLAVISLVIAALYGYTIYSVAQMQKDIFDPEPSGQVEQFIEQDSKIEEGLISQDSDEFKDDEKIKSIDLENQTAQITVKDAIQKNQNFKRRQYREQQAKLGETMMYILPMIFILYLASIPLYILYQIAKIRIFWNNTNLENTDFKFTGTFGGMLKMIIGNFFIETFTFGILHPIAQMRWLRYFTNHLEIHGDLDLEAIAQREGEVMSYGEGLAEGFDFGGV